MVQVIDFHTHVFPETLAPRAIATLLKNAPKDKNYTDGTATGLKASMQQHGISYSVTLPIATKVDQVSVINNQQTAADRSCIVPFGALHPDTNTPTETINFLLENGIAGIKFHPEYQQFHIEDQRYFPLYEALSSAGIVVVFHAGKDPGPFPGTNALPDAFLTLRKNFPTLKLVAAHMGGWKVWNQVLETSAVSDMFFDTSAVYGILDKNLFMRIANKHGTDRILFGSDSPWFDQGEALRWIDSLPFSSSQKDKIFSQNARSLLPFLSLQAS